MAKIIIPIDQFTSVGILNTSLIGETPHFILNIGIKPELLNSIQQLNNYSFSVIYHKPYHVITSNKSEMWKNSITFPEIVEDLKSCSVKRSDCELFLESTDYDDELQLRMAL